VECKLTFRRPPPIVDGSILGPSVNVIGIPRKAELDIVPGKLSDPVQQIRPEKIHIRDIRLPDAVSLLAIGVDMGNYPPLIV
jgi:hypothetical protein